MNNFRNKVLNVVTKVGNSATHVNYVDYAGRHRSVNETTPFNYATAMCNEFKSREFLNRFLQTLGKKLPTNHNYHKNVFASRVLHSINVEPSVSSNGHLELLFSMADSKYHRSMNVLVALLQHWVPNGLVEIQSSSSLFELPKILVLAYPSEVNEPIRIASAPENQISPVKPAIQHSKSPVVAIVTPSVAGKEALKLKMQELSEKSMALALEIGAAQMNLNKKSSEYDTIKTQMGIISQAMDIL